MSKLLEKIGRIEAPFSKEVNCAYVSTILKEVEKHKGEAGLEGLFSRLFCDHLDLDWKQSKLEIYLRDQHSWIDSLLSGAIFEIGMELLNKNDFHYYIGKNSLNLSSLHVTVGKFFSTKGVYKLISYANSNYNDVIELEVYEKRKKQNSIVLRKWSKDNYKDKIIERMGTEGLLRQWMKNDCDITKGILEAIPSIFNKSDAKVIDEPYCESRGDPFCQYLIEWQSEMLGDRGRAFVTKLFTLDHHWQMKERIRKIQTTVKERTRELSEANYGLERAYKKLEINQSKLIESEKRSLEHRITGGFAHEMRNALAGAQLEFKTTMNYKDQGKPSAEFLKESATGLLKNISDLHEEYGIPREKIATLVLPQLKTIAEIADHLSGTICGVSKDIDRGLSITTQIRDYARMSELKPGDTSVDVVQMLKGYEERYRQDFERIGIVYSVEGIEKAIVKAEEIHLDSIFGNLIRNAKDALEDFETDKPKEIKVTVNKKDDESGSFIFIKVGDNGPGIPEEHLNEIFEPFFSTKPSSGTGLGLGIVKRLVQLYGGAVEVESVVGEGCSFIVMFLQAGNPRESLR